MSPGKPHICYNLNLLKFIETFFGLNIWSILENFPCALEKNVYSTAFGWNVFTSSLIFYLKPLFLC